MPRYRYVARTSERNLVSGELEAAAPGGAADQLLRRGLFPVRIEAQSTTPDVLRRIGRVLHGPVQFEDLVFFTRQMYSIVRSGIPIHQGIRTLADAARHPAMRDALLECRRQLEEGRPLSDALAMHGAIFGPIMVNLIRTGEETGRLEQAFQELQRNLETDHANDRQIRATMRYPTLVVGAIVVAFILLNLFVIPAFAGVFANFGAELPAITRGLMATSGFMKTHGIGLFIVVAGAVLGVRAWTRSSQGAIAWGRTALRLPLIGGILLKATLARFCRVLAMCARSGIVLDQALGNAAEASPNPYFAARLRALRDDVARGDSLTFAARRSTLFTPLVLQMISIGEDSGSLENMLDEAAAYYEREVAHEVSLLGAYMEPILLIFVSGLVLLLALGIFLPMWDMASVALRR